MMFEILFLFCTAVDLADDAAGDLDSQGEKLYRIRALSLTPEFTSVDMTGYLFFYRDNAAAHEHA
jgi:hypothetical protein